MQVLATKLVAPRPPPAMVSRPRLCQLLSRSALRPLTLVSAPAGWGKTSLLSEWIDSGAYPGRIVVAGAGGGGWRPSTVLGRRDRRAPRSLGRTSRVWLVRSGATIDAFLTSLMNALDASPDPLVLVLDDLQDAASPELVADLDRLVEHAPPSLRLVVSTRVDPQLRLERLRLAGRVAEVRAADLALTRDEARSLCDGAGVELNDRELDLLLERTGGWPTGVRLAAVSLQGRQDPGAFVESFAGDDRGVSGYLVSEVLSRQPPETLDFLLRTCQVDRVSGALADELTGGSAGRATLEELAARHGLVTPLDTRGDWYQYPPLLREVLRLESTRRVPDALPHLHRRAARWFAERGEALDAIRHAVAGEAWDLVAEMVGQHWLPLARAREGVLSPRVRRTHPSARCRRGRRTRVGGGRVAASRPGTRALPMSSWRPRTSSPPRCRRQGVCASRPQRQRRLSIARGCGATWTPP